MKSNLISKSETALLLNAISQEWGIEIPKNKNIKMHHITDDAQILTGQGIKILKTEAGHVPFLSETDMLERFPRVVIDMGAVRFMCKGANLMRPGIKRYTEFEKGSLVCIAEESQSKFLAVGRSLVPSSQLESMQKGEILENLHYISDKFWEIGKAIR